MGHEVEAGIERVRDRIRGKNQLTTSQARPTVNLTDPLVVKSHFNRWLLDSMSGLRVDGAVIRKTMLPFFRPPPT